MALGGAVGVVALGFGGLYVKAATQLNRIERIDIAGTGQVQPDEPVSILLVGTDASMDLSNGEPPAVRADAMILVRLDPGADTARVLSIPRDLDVSEPDMGVSRLADQMATGGIATLVSDIEGLGLDIDHVVTVDYSGFRSLVDAVGGIDLNISTPLRDTSSGLAIADPGCKRLDGAQALALARSRHLERLEGGDWVVDPTGDLGRTDRQRMMLLAAAAQLREQVPDPFTADRLSSWALEHVTVDAELTTDRLVDLVSAVSEIGRNVDPSTRLPTVEATGPNGEAVLRLTDGLDETVAWFEGTHRSEPESDSPPSSATPLNDIAIAPC